MIGLTTSRRLSILLFLFGCLTLPLHAFRVIIDAGHGGHDRGAQTSGVYEKHLALDTAFRLKRYLNKRGIRTTMTRSSNRFISLDQRVAIGNRYRDAVFVSIHYNSAYNKAATGIETFYYTSRSGYLAGIVQYNLIHKLRAKNRGVKHRGFRVIRNARNPAILVEGGFLSNSRERRKCLSPTYRQKVAEAVGYALVQYQKRR